MQTTLSGEAARARIVALVEPWIAERRAQGERVGDVLRHPAYGRIPVDAMQAMPELGTLRDTLLREAGAMTDRTGTPVWSRRTVAVVLLLAAMLFGAQVSAQQVALTPDSLTLAVGDTARVVATVRGATDQRIAYRGTNAAAFTTHRDGRVTARAAGCGYVRAGIVDSTWSRAQVRVCVVAAAPPVDTVVPPPPPPPPPPSGAWAANRPAGLTRITDSYFGGLRTDALNADGLAYAWDGRNGTDASAPFGPDVFETFYPGNHRGNGEGGASLYGRGNQQWREIYFALMLWVPANYSMHTNGEKFWYPVITTNGRVTSSTMLLWHTPEWAGYPGGASDSTWVFGLQTQIGDTNRYQPRDTPRLVKGRWQQVEVHMVMNTPGQRNGVLRVWVDGRPALAWTDVRYSAQSAQGVIDAIRFEGVRGGGASSVLTPPGGQVRRYSRLAFYAAP
jgi:hypothetical protein